MSRSNEGVLPDPLAYFLTWATYGTWLPGDERGWIEHRHGWKCEDGPREVEAALRMTTTACTLEAAERRLVEETIRAHCRRWAWVLHAVNCRSNHVHVVVTASLHPDGVRDQLKAWCTRKLKEQACKGRPTDRVRDKWWAERGSRRYLNQADDLEAAILYVRDGQNKPR
jgi:REP element-mobilizing transposase RayT